MLDRDSTGSTIRGYMFNGFVEIKCIPSSDKSNKPSLSFKLVNMHQLSVVEKNQLIRLKKEIGFRIKDKKFVDPLTGDRKVEEAIYRLMEIADKGITINGHKFTSYPNSTFRDHLENFRKELSEKIVGQADKGKKEISKSRLAFISEYNPGTKSQSGEHSHEVSEGTIIRNDKGKSYFLKKNPGAITQIEAFNSELFRLLLGKNYVSKSLVIYDENGMRRGIASRKIENFIPLRSVQGKYINAIETFSQKLIDKGIGKIETANMIFGNPDAHFYNIGFNNNTGQLCIIDFDQALFEITCKYLGYDPDKTFFDAALGEHKPSPKDFFKVNEKDIRTLPNVGHSLRGLKVQYTFFNGDINDNLNAMANNENFIRDKWYTFLKYLLIGDKAYETLLNDFLTSHKHKKEIFDYLINRKDEFKKALLNIPEFINFILKEGNKNLPQIKDEFKKFKNDYRKLGLDPDSIDEEFNSIYQDCKHNFLDIHKLNLTTFQSTLKTYQDENKLTHSRNVTAERLLEIIKDKNIPKDVLARILILEYDTIKKGSGDNGIIAKAIKNFLINTYGIQEKTLFVPHLPFPFEQLTHYGAQKLLAYVEKNETSFLYKISPKSIKDNFENEFRMASDYAYQLMLCKDDNALKKLLDNIEIQMGDINNLPSELRDIFRDIKKDIKARLVFEANINQDPQELFNICLENLKDKTVKISYKEKVNAYSEFLKKKYPNYKNNNPEHTIKDELLGKLLKILQDGMDNSAKCKEMMYLIEVTKRELTARINKPTFGFFDSNNSVNRELNNMVTILKNLQTTIKSKTTQTISESTSDSVPIIELK